MKEDPSRPNFFPTLESWILPIDLSDLNKVCRFSDHEAVLSLARQNLANSSRKISHPNQTQTNHYKIFVIRSIWCHILNKYCKYFKPQTVIYISSDLYKFQETFPSYLLINSNLTRKASIYEFLKEEKIFHFFTFRQILSKLKFFSFFLSFFHSFFLPYRGKFFALLQ